ncbi:Isocitrate/isopropylmalate dehydrogenase domain containing protein [Elaphomyces granulatus]
MSVKARRQKPTAAVSDDNDSSSSITGNGTIRGPASKQTLHPPIAKEQEENVFLFYPNLIDGLAARHFEQSTTFGAVLDMVTDRCTTACLLVFLSSAWPRWAILFQSLISLDMASHYMHMYATLTMGGSGQSHKKVDSKRSWILYQYYHSRTVLFICCALNELFFIGLYLLSFSSPMLSPSLLQPLPDSQLSSAQPGSPAHPIPSTLFASPWSAGALELARANKLDSFWPWVITGIAAPVMALKQFINVVQLVKASRCTVVIMPSYNIVVFAGDCCGPEVTTEALKALEVVQKCRNDIKFIFQHHNLGGASIDATGTPLTDEALEAAKSADAVILGAIGGPKWGTGSVRPEQGLLKLRKEMGTFGNLRPCYFAAPSLVDISPLKVSVCSNVDFTIVRELTGGIYFGERKEDTGDGHALDTEPYSRAEIERITRLAAHLALQRDPPLPVISLDKANVLATSRLWRKVVSEVIAAEFPQLKISHQLIDSAAMIMVRDPRQLNGIIVTSNLFGDIISDEASVIPGSLGLLPSASLSGIPDGKSKVNGIYEPIHGSAPDIAGKGIVNPVAAILSMAMMLRFSLGRPAEARAIETAVRNVIEAGIRTGDIGGKSSTKEVGNAVAVELEK